MARQCFHGAVRAGATSLRSATREPSGTRTPAKFSRASRILRSADFRLVYDKGTRVTSPLFAAFCLARPEPSNHGARLGLTVPRAIGGAVVRNRIKRRLREAFRLHRAAFGPQWDIVINPRRAALGASFPEIERALGKVIEKCVP